MLIKAPPRAFLPRFAVATDEGFVVKARLLLWQIM